MAPEHAGTAAREGELNLAAWHPRSCVNGPGERFVLWVQGCDLRCPGCSNSAFLARRRASLVAIETLAAAILSVPGLDGVTFSGGEPTLQAGALARLARRVRAAGCSVLCYTGHTLADLRRRGGDTRELLEACDTLIDGPYVAREAAALPWRGSRNQRVHFLTPRHEAWAGAIDDPVAQVEFAVGAQRLTTTGVGPVPVLRAIEGRFRELLERPLAGAAEEIGE